MDKDVYDRFAKNYDARWARFSEITIAQALAHFSTNLSHKTVLDIGCGTGTLIEKLLKEHPEIGSVTGIDVSRSMMQQAEKKLKGNRKVKLIHQTGKTINLPAQSFDIVVSTNTFHYFINPRAKLQEMKQLIKNNGLLILEDYSKDSLLVKWFEWIIRFYDSWHQKAYTLEEAEQMVSHAGFTILQVAQFPIDVFWKGWVIQAR